MSDEGLDAQRQEAAGWAAQWRRIAVPDGLCDADAEFQGESLRAFGHVSDQARKIVRVDGLDQMVIEAVLQ